MDIDKNDVLKRAEELLKENNEIDKEIEVSDKEKQLGSYDDENSDFEDNENVSENFFEEGVRDYRHKLGYEREPRYKPPSVLKFFFAIVMIILLGIIIGLMLPYVPVILS